MKFLFIVQGEGRGHLTQSMTLEKILLDRGHEVVGIMVGKSPQRRIPDFFTDEVTAPVTYFESMNFMPAADIRLLLRAANALGLNRMHWHLTDDQG